MRERGRKLRVDIDEAERELDEAEELWLERLGKVVVDTYAIIADLTGQAPSGVTEVLDNVRKGTIKGILHYLVVYELAYHWKRGRLPFRDEGELLEFVNRYFTITALDLNIAIEGVGCEAQRKLTVADATTVAIAVGSGAPIVTGDTDLSYIARMLLGSWERPLSGKC